jgi:hypothetical protein
MYHDSRAVVVNVNLKADELFAPVSGPQHPLHRDALIPGQKNILTGKRASIDACCEHCVLTR